MLILGIESSCDDTGAAVVEDGAILRSSIVSSQDAIHAKYGGIVPELASRQHIEMIIPVVDEALKQASVTIEEIDGVAVTQGPGLVGSLLVGLSFAKSLSYTRAIPLASVNHIEAHVMAAFLHESNGTEKNAPDFPFVALVVSGGHTTLLHVKDFTCSEIIGHTVDDAAGEAFDKVAKLLGLGYPGGLAIDRLAKDGNPSFVEFTRPYMAKGNLNFSFSGVKTAVLTYVKGHKSGLPPETLKDLAASFQETVVDVLVSKAMSAVSAMNSKTLVLAGGVACNSRLRAKLKAEAHKQGLSLFIPEAHLCTDNGAMIAALGYHQIKKGRTAGLDLNAKPNWD